MGEKCRSGRKHCFAKSAKIPHGKEGAIRQYSKGGSKGKMLVKERAMDSNPKKVINIVVVESILGMLLAFDAIY